MTKEIELTDRDFQDIWDATHAHYINTNIIDKNTFLCRCFTRALVDWLSAKKYTIQNNKIIRDNKFSWPDE